MPPKKKVSVTSSEVEQPIYNLTNKFLLPNVTVKTLLEAFQVRVEKSSNIDLWDKLSLWTVTNGKEERIINLNSFDDKENDSLALNYDLNDVFQVSEEPESTTEVEYSPIVHERLRQIENAKKLEEENAKKGKGK